MARNFKGFVLGCIGFIFHAVGFSTSGWISFRSKYHYNTSGMWQYCYGDQTVGLTCKGHNHNHWDQWNIIWTTIEVLGIVIYLVSLIVCSWILIKKLSKRFLIMGMMVASGCTISLGFGVFILISADLYKRRNIGDIVLSEIGYSAWCSLIGGIIALLSSLLHCACSCGKEDKYYTSNDEDDTIKDHHDTNTKKRTIYGDTPVIPNIYLVHYDQSLSMKGNRSSWTTDGAQLWSSCGSLTESQPVEINPYYVPARDYDTDTCSNNESII